MSDFCSPSRRYGTRHSYSTELVIQITRILREEAVLNKDKIYRDYAEQVRYRLVPMVF